MVDAIASMPQVADVSTMMGPGLSSGMGMKLGAGASDAQIDKASKDFEAMFATQMIQPMFESVPVNSAFGGGHGEEVMRTFILQEYGKQIAKTGRLGIAPQIKSEMLRAQGRTRDAELAKNPALASAAAAANAYARAPLSQTSQGETHVAN
jgi:flagellar protein FlgJ